MDAEVANMYLSNREQFDQTAKFWTDTYAVKKEADAKLGTLTQMGFDEATARSALEKCNGDEMQAMEYLLSNA